MILPILATLSAGLTGLLMFLLVIAVVAVLAFYVIGEMKLPHPINLIVRVIVGVVLLFIILNHFAL